MPLPSFSPVVLCFGVLPAFAIAPLRADLPANYVTSNGIKMILIRAGSFQMGNSQPGYDVNGKTYYIGISYRFGQ
jgi:hypothetical protein